MAAPIITMTEPEALVRLMTWLSPAFPTGGFAYSHGMEQAIREGLVTGADELFAWIETLLQHGSGWTDAVLFAAAWRARDPYEVQDVAELAEALSPSLERRLESLNQGEAFLTAAEPWGVGGLVGEVAYPVAVGRTAAVHALPLETAVAAWLNAFSANLVSAAVRAVPLGQTDGVRVLARLESVLLGVAQKVANSSLMDLGGFALISDIVSMRHETLQPRLFRS